MILDAIFIVSVLMMVISLFFGTVECAFLSTIITLVIVAIWYIYRAKGMDDSKVFANLNEKKCKKESNFHFSQYTKCFHTNTDCEECISQSNCPLKHENIIVEE